MRKNLPIIILLIFLVVMNGILLFLLLDKPDRQNRPPRDFITNQLGFDENQKQEFRNIDEEHHKKMRNLHNRSTGLKKYLFNKLRDEDFTNRELDSVTVLVGELSRKKEKEVFSYFKEIEKVCDEEQKNKLEAILSGALRHGPNAMGHERM
ncbi:MAG: hypothetical protein ABJP76_05610 [Flavobacteriaceae bacterium]